ncbi:putative integrase/recombinase [Pseudonocardia sp. Ae717_Ps2]|uniref:tyrosine-type recombinase/integrase n=1 Tax=Pseudonocardia sp. Ae717_Ps2 TaxID=1885573 RepID=UPI00095D7B12|nr:tyrosine-type recombinase/integrase [Pseudonocardia sp. Ae717_Ps2]OLM28591.1 putative integrase/recombinase [Pseudonocardia sp. Ae717_Ps2]
MSVEKAVDARLGTELGPVAGASTEPDTQPATELDTAVLAGGVAAAAARAASLAALAARADAHAVAARAPSTRHAYAGDWAHFARWCTAAGLASLPAAVDTVRLYLADLEATRTPTGQAVFSPATMGRRLAAIAAAHHDAGHWSPTRDPAVGSVLTGIKRARAHTRHQMRPLLLDDLRTVLAGLGFGSWPAGLIAARDAAALLIGFAGALRRSELAALTAADLVFHPVDGLHVHIARSKTDQTGRGATVVLPYGTRAGTCPPCAVLRWLQLLAAASHGRPALMRTVLTTPAWPDLAHLFSHPGPTDATATAAVDTSAPAEAATAQASLSLRAPVPVLAGDVPLLRAIRRSGTLTDTPLTGDALHAMVRRRAHAAGLPGPVGFHSLRAGFVTTARRNGADHRSVRRQTRHSSDTMIETYDRDHAPLLGNAVTRLGL